MRRIVLALALALFVFVSQSQQVVTASYPSAYCIKGPLETRYKVFPGRLSMVAIGYGLTEADAWDDAAARLPQH